MTMTVLEAQRIIVENIEDGTVCPCCDRYIRGWKRKIRATHVRFLAALSSLSTRQDPWVHWRRAKLPGDPRDYNYLRHFGLAEMESKSSGLWRPTESGLSFLNRDLRIPEWVLVINNEVYVRAPNLVTVDDCIAGAGFSYEDLTIGEGS